MPDKPIEGKRTGACWLALLLARRSRMRAAQNALASSGAASGAASGPRGGLTRFDVSLADLKPGECGYVAKLLGGSVGRLRLLEMGLTPGTHVHVIRVAAFGGPMDVEIRGYQLSLRRDEAAAVWLAAQEET